MEPMQPMKPMKPMEPIHFKETPRWWPEGLGNPNSAGSQNDVEYAYFSGPKRLLMRHGNEIVTYDTADHDIQGVSQASDMTHATFTSNHGTVHLSQLKRL